MRHIRRLAIIDRGEPVVRILAAVADLNRRGGHETITTIVVTDQSREHAWFARNADEVVRAQPQGDTGLSAGDLVAAVQLATADTVWIGDAPCLDRAELVELLAAAHCTVVGPAAQTIRDLADPGRLAELGQRAGLLPLPAEQPLDDCRRIEVDVLVDDAGTVWTMGLRETTVRVPTGSGADSGRTLLVAEQPAWRVPEPTAGAMSHAARRLMREAAYRGAGVVELALAPDGERFWLLGVDTVARVETALFEELTDADLVVERLLLAAGGSLAPEPPHITGHAVAVRLLVRDDSHGYAAEAGAVRMLALPVGSGVRLDTSIREGDRVDGRIDALVATIAAWGRDRAEALDRAAAALQRTTVVVEHGSTNRTELIALVARLSDSSEPLTLGWHDEAGRRGELQPPADPLALVAAAVEAYESDSTLVNAAFFATAARGRPVHPEAVGTRVHLSYRGHDYRMRVDRTGPRTYRVRGTAVVEVDVDRLGAYERRLVCRGRQHRLVATEQGADIRLELDGVTHVVVREDGAVVRAGSPALVSDLLVRVGQQVTVGQPVAVLESMKMVTTLTAPFHGTVTSLAVSPNTQVERGAALLRIKATALDSHPPAEPVSPGSPRAADPGPVGPVGPVGSVGPDQAVDLATVAVDDDAISGKDSTWVHQRLGDYLLGYDLDPESFKALLRRQAQCAADAPADDADLLSAEDRLLDLFADLGALYRPRTESEAAVGELGATNTQEFFLAYLQWLDPVQAGLPERYRCRLERAFARYGVTGLTRSPALEAAAVWMFRSFERVPVIAPAIVAILSRRLSHHEQLSPLASTETRERLRRLGAAAEGRQQTIADLARDLDFHLFEEPSMLAAAGEAQTRTAEHLQSLRTAPQGPDRAKQIEALVAAAHPLRGQLLAAWRSPGDGPQVDAAGAAYRAAVLEIYIRRFYRIRQLHHVGTTTAGDFLVGHADYQHEGLPVHLVVGYAALHELPRLAQGLAAHLAGVPAERECVLDLALWREGPRTRTSALSAELLDALGLCDFGRPLHRLDFTVTSLGDPDAQGQSTQHLTFRQNAYASDSAATNFVEEILYRNLHPMLAKRLDIWRLSNFELTRLASPEDVYLFLGVAHDNPKDKRLFALTEVRDLVSVRDEQTGTETYPRLGRVGLQALAAMRTALSQYPPRERPTANRLVLWVRPTWEIPQSQWPALAGRYLPLARGAGLEKLVLHVRTPDEQQPEKLVNKVLTVDGIGRTGTTIRFGDPGPNPVRPLTRYAQKVLTAERFDAPYPYEIVHMLTPGPDEPSPFPRGHFQELELDPDGLNLVPTDRPPAGNSAHLVVGLLTNYTDLVPEGMTRVAMLSDPTQGLGNLAEPECRRINAALKLAAERGLPVEWYAVSSGALIAMDSGTENMDFISLTLRRIIEFTQGGGEINIIVTGINVGGQPYWNAESTMLMHTRGILVMTPNSAMVLTGKQALDFSGAVSADDNFGIGGYDRVMGLNGQGQYWAPSFQDACRLLLHHYDFTYVVPGERFPRRRATSDPHDRDVRQSPHEQVPGTRFTSVAEVFDRKTNPDRKQPFDMRSVMRSVADTDCEPLERWQHWQDGENSIVWDVTVGGIPVCMLGLSSRALPRKGFVPADGPSAWTSGTLFPQASRKTARAINATSGNRPLVVMANLSGFDGSPESMRKWQLEYGAEIGRAITNFKGPIVFVVVSRYHGGAFVVFSKQLNEGMEIAAIEGAFASVIGGAPAAATVFARDVKIRTDKDPRVVAARTAVAEAKGGDIGRLRAQLATITAAVRSEKLGEVADEFDSIHTIERAQRMGSVDRIIQAEQLRPYVIDALERGMAKFAPTSG